MKEEEARKKECPQHLIMMALVQGVAVRSGADKQVIVDCGGIGYCTASDCMMWAWDEDQPRTGNSKDITGKCGLIR